MSQTVGAPYTGNLNVLVRCGTEIDNLNKEIFTLNEDLKDTKHDRDMLNQMVTDMKVTLEAEQTKNKLLEVKLNNYKNIMTTASNMLSIEF